MRLSTTPPSNSLKFDECLSMAGAHPASGCSLFLPVPTVQPHREYDRNLERRPVPQGDTDPVFHGELELERGLGKDYGLVTTKISVVLVPDARVSAISLTRNNSLL